MRFDINAVARLMEGDASALDELVEFDDGTVKALRDCTRFDLDRMDAWATYQTTLARVGMEECDHELTRRRRERLRAVNE